MSPALRRLHTLWWQPGREMATGWWMALGLSQWQQPYARQPLLRPALDRLVANRLGHCGAVPTMSSVAESLLADDRRRDALCLALGLWVLRCPDYLLLRRYRAALSPMLDAHALNQLQALMPLTAAQAAELEPGELTGSAFRAGAAWLAGSNDPALALCRLLWEPSAAGMSQAATPDAVLQKLLRWL